jgi:hypothetical protein
MGGNTPKQFLSLEGVPIFVHTLRKFGCVQKKWTGRFRKFRDRTLPRPCA